MVGTGAALAGLAAGVIAAAPAGAAEVDAPQGGPDSTSAAAPAKAPGFVPVRALAGYAAAVAPAKGELWVLEDGAGTAPVVLEHLQGRTWTREVIAPAGTWVDGSLAATGRDDVWLSAQGAVRHYDGRRWTPVPAPKAANGSPRTVGMLATADRGTLYAAVNGDGWNKNAHIYRYRRGAWTDLGLPPSITQPESFGPKQVLATATGFSVLAWGAGMRTTVAYDHVNGAWTDSRVVAAFHGYWSRPIGGYFVDGGTRHLVLGGYGLHGLVPDCRQWTGGGATADCTTTVVAAAAAKLKNGSIVIGGSDHPLPLVPKIPGTTPGQRVEASFVLRSPSGAERRLAGDPGSLTLGMIPELGQNAAWAITVDNSRSPAAYQLQRYDG